MGKGTGEGTWRRVLRKENTQSGRGRERGYEGGGKGTLG